MLQNNASVSAILLAGGQSSRMGRDKALIDVQGMPLIRQVYDVAQDCATKVYVVTSWWERYREVLPPECEFVQEMPLPGETTLQGPLVGFSQGLAEVETEWVLLLACDLPNLRRDVLQDWASQLDKVAAEVLALLPRNPQGWEPLCGFYRRRCLPLLHNFINQGGRSFQEWLNQQPVQELPLSDRQMLLNCNTPNDLNQIRS